MKWGGKEKEEANTKPRLSNTALSAGKEMRMDWEALGNLDTILREKNKGRNM